jgi:hypothetical protein
MNHQDKVQNTTDWGYKVYIKTHNQNALHIGDTSVNKILKHCRMVNLHDKEQ